MGVIRIAAFATLAALCRADMTDRDIDQVQVRLLTPISSESRAGTPFVARVLGPVHATEPVLPRGTLVLGHVSKARAVGLGLRNERALLQLTFERCTSPAGQDLECELELLAIDNAREKVRAGNTVDGILAAAHLHSWLNGLWFRPTTAFAWRAVLGLTGAAGVVQSRLIPNPVGATAVLVSKLAFLRMPDPEIQLPAGVEMNLRVLQTSWRAEGAEAAANSSTGSELQQALVTLPTSLTRQNGALVQDLMNIAILGDAATIAAAFEAAGWSRAEATGVRTGARMYRAYAGMSSYSTAPVSLLLYEGRPPDFVFQKGFNSVAKRHHIRIWSLPDVENVFIAAATHDIRIGIEGGPLRATHIIDPEIDKERTKVANDLADAGCAASVNTFHRPELASESTDNEENGDRETDGMLLVIKVQSCPGPSTGQPLGNAKKMGLLRRTAQRAILETRHYFTRGNAIYWAARGVQSGLSRASASLARRRTDSVDQTVADANRGESGGAMEPEARQDPGTVAVESAYTEVR